MSDRDDIYDLMVRYGRSLDTYDIDLLRTCFTDDATVDYVDVSAQPLVGIDTIADFFTAGLRPMECSHHFTNFAFEIDGDAATYRCYVLAQHWPRGTSAVNGAFFMAGTRYENRVRRTTEGWRICHTWQAKMWMSGDLQNLEHFEGPANG